MEAGDIDVRYNWNSTSGENDSHPMELPIDMKFNDGHLLAIIVYSLLMIISAIGNILVLCVIVRLRLTKHRLSRISLLLLHLNIADLLVTFIMMPLEIIWIATVSWRAGDLVCRLLSFFRMFGLCLSGFLLICISIDRYFAIIKPLRISNAKVRVKRMLLVAWISSAVCSMPQVFIFHVETHPVFTWYEQCVTFNSFPSEEYEMAYNFFGLLFLYGIPMTTIVVCYSRILYKIYGISMRNGNDELRRSSMGSLSRAKMRTVKMTITIVATFFLCWTPYNIMSLWYWFDRSSALQVDQRIQKCLFLFACTNSCVNPVIYGYFHFQPSQNCDGHTGKHPNIKEHHHCSNSDCELIGIAKRMKVSNKRVRWKRDSGFTATVTELDTSLRVRNVSMCRSLNRYSSRHVPVSV